MFFQLPSKETLLNLFPAFRAGTVPSPAQANPTEMTTPVVYVTPPRVVNTKARSSSVPEPPPTQYTAPRTRAQREASPDLDEHIRAFSPSHLDSSTSFSPSASMYSETPPKKGKSSDRDRYSQRRNPSPVMSDTSRESEDESSSDEEMVSAALTTIETPSSSGSDDESSSVEEIVAAAPKTIEIPSSSSSEDVVRAAPAMNEISSSSSSEDIVSAVPRNTETPPRSDKKSESKEDSSAEEEIVSAGAKATMIPPRELNSPPRARVMYEGRNGLQPEPDEYNEEESDYTSEEDEGMVLDGPASKRHKVRPVEEEQEREEEVKPRHTGFPPVEDLPTWFPENIKQMYRVERHGGALSYKELNEITRYRAALEFIYRRKWREYTVAGRARLGLQKALQKLRRRPLTKAFYKHRKRQFKTWKEKGLRLWKRLEKTHNGILFLDETVKINFRQERVIWAKRLGPELRP